jgi:hypothetical protein
MRSQHSIQAALTPLTPEHMLLNELDCDGDFCKGPRKCRIWRPLTMWMPRLKAD